MGARGIARYATKLRRKCTMLWRKCEAAVYGMYYLVSCREVLPTRWMPAIHFNQPSWPGQRIITIKTSFLYPRDTPKRSVDFHIIGRAIKPNFRPEVSNYLSYCVERIVHPCGLTQQLDGGLPNSSAGGMDRQAGEAGVVSCGCALSRCMIDST